MKPETYFWTALSVVLCSLGAYVEIDSVKHPGPYAEEYILLGGTLAALGLALMVFAFKQRAQLKALSQHMRGGSRSYTRSQARG